MLKTTKQCYLTVKKLLQNEDYSLKTLKEVAKLHKLLGYDEEAIKYYKAIIKGKRDPTTLRELAQTYVKVRDFGNAIYILCHCCKRH